MEYTRVVGILVYQSLHLSILFSDLCLEHLILIQQCYEFLMVFSLQVGEVHLQLNKSPNMLLFR